MMTVIKFRKRKCMMADYRKSPQLHHSTIRDELLVPNSALVDFGCFDANHNTFFRSHCQDSSFFPIIAQPNFTHGPQEPSPELITRSDSGKVVLSSVEERELPISALLGKIWAFPLLSLSQTMPTDPRNLRLEVESDRRLGTSC